MKALIMFFCLVALHCSACNHRDNKTNRNILGYNNPNKVISPISAPGEGYSSPNSFFRKGRFCIVVYGDRIRRDLLEIEGNIIKKMDTGTTDYHFVDMAQAKESEKSSCSVDFPSLEGIYAISASGGLIKKSVHPTLSTVDSIMDTITEWTRLYRINGIALSDFASFKTPEIHESDKRKIYLVGSFDKTIVPYEFCEKNSSSVIIFSTPGCGACIALKTAIKNNPELENKRVNFYFVDLAGDDMMKEHKWSDVKMTKALKTYSMEGAWYSFPIVWIVSPTGTISSTVDAYKTGGMPLFDYIIKSIDSFTAPPIPAPNPIVTEPIVNSVKNEQGVVPQDNKNVSANTVSSPGNLISNSDPQAEMEKGKSENKVNENKTIVIPVTSIVVSPQIIKLSYKNEGNVPACKMNLIVKSLKGLQVIQAIKDLSLNNFEGTIDIKDFNLVGDFDKRTKYTLSIEILVDNTTVFKSGVLEFKTDGNKFATIKL